MKVCVVGGAGYIGLITSVGLASLGHQVCAIDVNRERIDMLRRGKSPILEAGLESLLQRQLASGALGFSDSFDAMDQPSEVAIICVGTPWGKEDSLDLSQVWQALRSVAPHLSSSSVLVFKSTVPFGVLEQAKGILRESRHGKESVALAVTPEFLREGRGIEDFFFPSRVVVGTHSQRARDVIKELYTPLLEGSIPPEAQALAEAPSGPIPWIETDPTSAIMIKYASNAFLATRVSMINEIAAVCGEVGANTDDVVAGMGHDPRIMPNYLSPGAGFGGPCLEKDLKTLLTFASGNPMDLLLLRAVLERNDQQIRDLVDALEGYLEGGLSGKTVTIYGLAFKAHTNDVRDSVSLKAVDILKDKGAQVRAYDPVIQNDLHPGLTCFEDPYEAVAGSHGLMVLTGWPELVDLDYARVKRLMASPVVVDGRNCLNPSLMRELGFKFSRVGGQSPDFGDGSGLSIQQSQG